MRNEVALKIVALVVGSFVEEDMCRLNGSGLQVAF